MCYSNRVSVFLAMHAAPRQILVFAVCIGCAALAEPSGNQPQKPRQGIIARSEAGYIQAMQYLFRMQRKTEKTNENCEQLFENARSSWLAGRFGADASDTSASSIQAAWPKNTKAPPPGIGLAAWVLALHEQQFGIIGANRMSWVMLQSAYKRKAIVCAETADGYRWVVDMRKKLSGNCLVLSDGTEIGCGKNPQAELCSAPGLRQWILVFPYTWRGCQFLKNTRVLARSVSGSLFWYPEFLEQYLRDAGTGATGDPLPSVPRRISCDK